MGAQDEDAPRFLRIQVRVHADRDAALFRELVAIRPRLRAQRLVALAERGLLVTPHADTRRPSVVSSRSTGSEAQDFASDQRRENSSAVPGVTAPPASTEPSNAGILAVLANAIDTNDL